MAVSEQHPLVFIAEGPAGPRARLQGTGADVWEVIATLKDSHGDQRAAAEYLSLPIGLVQAAKAYYDEFPAEIDRRIQQESDEGKQAERDLRRRN